MQKLTRNDLFSLEKYAEVRAEFRSTVMQHKKTRRVAIGEHVNLYFEDRLTVQYQIQEMLRIERIFEVAAIEEELAAYNPLIPDGKNLKATLMIEYSDEVERREALKKLIGIEEKIWLQVADYEKIYPITDEDLERQTADKTSAVHFLRFELTDEMIMAAKAKQTISIGIDHPAYQQTVSPIAPAIQQALVADF